MHTDYSKADFRLKYAQLKSDKEADNMKLIINKVFL